jgi:UDP-N-acetyl-D-glucosamine dehydrogenase
MQELIDKIEQRTAHCCVIGLGYVGLPLALEFSKAGFRVTGIDLDERKVEAIARGRSYIVDVRDEELADPVQAKRFTATTDFSVIETATRSTSASRRRWGRRRIRISPTSCPR